MASAILSQALVKTVCQIKTRSYIVSILAEATVNATVPEPVNWTTALPRPTFVLQVVRSPGVDLKSRQNTVPDYLVSTGDVLPFCQNGTEFTLRDQRLFSGSLSYSTRGDVKRSFFSGAQNPETIDESFSVINGLLVWRNPAFEGGAARFCAQGAGPVLAVFSGDLPEGYIGVELKAVAKIDCPAFLTPTASSSVLSTLVFTDPFIYELTFTGTDTSQKIQSSVNSNGDSAMSLSSLYTNSSIRASTTATGIPETSASQASPTTGPSSNSPSSLLSTMIPSISSIQLNGSTASMETFTQSSSVMDTVDLHSTQAPFSTTSSFDLSSNPISEMSAISSSSRLLSSSNPSNPSWTSSVTESNQSLSTSTSVSTSDSAQIANLSDATESSGMSSTSTIVFSPPSALTATLSDTTESILRTSTYIRNITVPSSVGTVTTTPTATRLVNITTTRTATTVVTTVVSRTLTVQKIIYQRREVQSLQLRQDPTAALTPEPLRALPTNVLSSACILNAAEPLQLQTITTTYPSTIVQTSYVITPANTTYTTNTLQTNVTISFGNSTMIMGSTTSAPDDIDDTYTSVSLPFPLQIGRNASTTVYVTSNGVLSLYSGTGDFENTGIPTTDLPAYSLCPFWDDTYIYEGNSQGIFYQIDGGNRVTFEYYLSHFSAAAEYYHFLVTYSRTQPGIFNYTYYQVSDSGSSATVGAQYGDGKFSIPCHWLGEEGG
ncbi:MAG: hypothetical protein Q9222_001310 [Ikaeria aurantiellina]